MHNGPEPAIFSLIGRIRRSERGRWPVPSWHCQLTFASNSGSLSSEIKGELVGGKSENSPGCKITKKPVRSIIQIASDKQFWYHQSEGEALHHNAFNSPSSNRNFSHWNFLLDRLYFTLTTHLPICSSLFASRILSHIFMNSSLNWLTREPRWIH